MNQRILQYVRAATIVALASVAMVALASQTSSPTGKAATIKTAPTQMTPWGEPDLQGIWFREAETPLQRPTKYRDKEFFTDAERAELDRQISGILARDNSEARRSRGTEKD